MREREGGGRTRKRVGGASRERGPRRNGEGRGRWRSGRVSENAEEILATIPKFLATNRKIDFLRENLPGKKRKLRL
jgi:hypothetical protein